MISEGEDLKLKSRLENLQKFNRNLNDARGPSGRPPNFGNSGRFSDDDDDDNNNNGGFGDRRPIDPGFGGGDFDSDFKLSETSPSVKRKVAKAEKIAEAVSVQDKDLNSDFRKIGRRVNSRNNRENFTIYNPPPVHIAAETEIPHPKLDVKDGYSINTAAAAAAASKDDGEINNSIELSDVPTHDVSFNRPITRVKDRKSNTIEVIPNLRQIPSLPPIAQDSNEKFHKFKDIEVQKDLKFAFPEIKDEIKEPKKTEKLPDENNILELDGDELYSALEDLLDIGVVDNKANEAFFSGGLNLKLLDKLNSISNSKNNYAFFDFLQSETCANLMKKNKLKIHIESGDIYIDNINTNESIYDFIRSQDNENYILIDHEFIFDGSLNDYFQFLQNVDQTINSSNDYLTHRNSKFLFYHFNNYLIDTQRETSKVRHTTVIKNKIAIKMMEKNNWQYFISTLMNIYLNDHVGGKQFSPEQENDVINYMQPLENIAEVYKKYYNLLAIYFHRIIQNLPKDEIDEIVTDLANHNIHIQNIVDLNAEELLDIFIHFYDTNGRFPGNESFIILPKFNLPTDIRNSEVDLKTFYETFKGTQFKALVSMQGLCAFVQSLASIRNRKVNKKIIDALEEYLKNMTEAVLNGENLNKTDSFFCNSQVIYFCKKVI